MAMTMRKRPREDDIHIKTAAGDSLQAESFILRSFSSCARQLPADAQEWDVSGLLYSGEPFSQDTVRCWVDCACSVIHGAAELGEEDLELMSSASGLHQLLSFAHAVGTADGLLQAICAQLADLSISVQLPEQTFKLCLGLHGCYYMNYDTLQLCYQAVDRVDYLGEPCVSAEQLLDVQKQAAQKAGALLHIAHMLRLKAVVDLVHGFVFRNMAFDFDLLHGVLELVFTDAVLDAALGSSTLSREAYMNTVLTMPCSFVSNGRFYNQIMQPIPPFKVDSKTGTITFRAQLRQNFAGRRVGDKVNVELALFDAGCESSLTVKELHPMQFPAQLLLGRHILNGAGRDKLMSSALNTPSAD